MQIISTKTVFVVIWPSQSDPRSGKLNDHCRVDALMASAGVIIEKCPNPVAIVTRMEGAEMG